MTSLGEARIESSLGRLVGTCRVRGVSVSPAIYPRLAIQLGISLSDIHPSSSGLPALADARTNPIRFRIVDIWGELLLASSGSVGILHWMDKREIRSNSYQNEDRVDLLCELDNARLARLDEARSGGKLDLLLYLRVVSENIEPVEPHDYEVDARIPAVHFSIPRDEWLTILKRIGFNSARVVEVTFRPEPDDAFVRAMDHFTAAEERLRDGLYNDAVADVRKVFDEIIRRVPVEKIKDVLGAHTHPSRAEQYNDIFVRLKKLTNRAVHAQADPVTFNRHEAQFIVASTGYLLGLLGDATLAAPQAEE
ncbi:MAG TPA: hypothetical protein VEQ60_21870 [Longimicrobium sp.]|nr:hypothetical protein [Longimicrobium sp.]